MEWQRDTRYFESLVKLRCASDLLALGVFPNAKEVSESLAAFQAVLRHCAFDTDDPDVLALSVGDGNTPRTACVFALRTRWRCVSVDPHLNVAKIPTWQARVKRLACFPVRAQDLPSMDATRLVIAAVHAHNDEGSGRGAESVLDVVLERLTGRAVFVVALPCCHRLSVGNREPDLDYRDPGILSPHNRVLVWRWR